MNEPDETKPETPKALILFVVLVLLHIAAPGCGCAKPKHPDRLPELLNGNG